MPGDLGGGEDSGLGGFEAGFGGTATEDFGAVDFGGGVADDGGGGGASDGILGALGGMNGSSPFSLEANKALARKLALASIRPRLAQFQEGIASLTQLVNASSQALTQRLAPQIEQARTALQQMFKQASQRFGPFGGGQTTREQARGAEAIGGQLTRLFGAIPEQARNALIALIENFQVVPQPTTPISQVSTQPFNVASVLGSMQAGAQLGQLGVRAYNAFNTPTQTGNAGVLANQTASNPFAGEL